MYETILTIFLPQESSEKISGWRERRKREEVVKSCCFHLCHRKNPKLKKNLYFYENHIF